MSGDRKVAINVDPHWRIAIIHSSFYPEEVSRLTEGAKKELMAAGIPEGHISMHEVPGSFEIPLIGRTIAEEKEADALIGLGIIVEGETHHAELIAAESARGIMDVQTAFGIPFAFEVLYVKNIEQARARNNKGEESARVVMQSLAQIRKLSS